jgi:glycerol transport system ATP-binding protein
VQVGLGSDDLSLQIGIRPQQLGLAAGSANSCALEGGVELAEISGSETYVHVRHGETLLVAQVPGIHPLPLESRCTLHVDAAKLHGFTADGRPLFAPGS